MTETLKPTSPLSLINSSASPNESSPTNSGPLFPSKSDLCGIAYSRATLPEFHETICRWMRGDRTLTATAGYVNPHVFNLAIKHEAVRRFLDKANIVAVDGVGFSWALWLLKGDRQERTVMTPLFDSVLTDATVPALRAAVIGGSEEVAGKGAEAINQASRNMKVVSHIDGYQPLAKYQEFVRQHEDVDIILVAMGTPRSEEFILEASPLFRGKLFWNIGGGTLNFYAGTLRRVPKIVSKLCLQWLWRMVFEPSIVPRYVIGIPVFAMRALQNRRQENKNGVYVC